MILRVINDFSFFFSLFIYLIYGPGLKMLIIWLLFDSAMLKCSFYYYDIIIIFTFPHAGAYLSLNCCLKEKKSLNKNEKKKRMSGIVRTFISAFYFLIHFQSYLPSHLHPWLYYLGFFFLSPHIWFLFLCVCLFFNFKNNEFCYLLLVYRCSAVMHT